VSHLLGFSYAPRFKNLQRQRLYIFKSRKRLDRSTWKIKPAGYADDEIVIQQWDEILRMIATIKLKEVTASDLFRRLNSYWPTGSASAKIYGKDPILTLLP